MAPTDDHHSRSRPAYRTETTASQVTTLHEPPPGATRPVPEALIQDLWRTQRFDHTALTTACGQPVGVLDPGRPNPDGGPDFRLARIRLGATEWRGDVEVHATSGGWTGHEHHLDPRYNAVVLHVTLHADVWTGSLLRADGSPLPELVLYPHLRAPLRTLLHQFYTRPAQDLLCAEHWTRVPEAVRRAWIREMAEERFEAKKERLVDRYLAAPNLEALLHERLFAGLGYAQNAEPMAMLARRIPLSLARTVEDPLDLEALHFGAGGLLPTPDALLESDRASADYVMDLRRRFARLNAHHEVPVMERTQWQFFRLRPANFPPLRIAQGVALLRKGGLLHQDPIGVLLHAFASDTPVQALRDAFQARPTPFWENHVRLEKTTKPHNPCIGERRIDTLLVNAVVPVLLLYAEQHDVPDLEAAAFEVLRRLPAPSDRITRRFKNAGTRPQHALDAQGLHQLYRTRCTEARCLTCAIGRSLLREDE